MILCVFFSEARDPTSEVNQAMKHELGNTVSIMDAFKRLGPVSGKRVKKYIPQRLKEVIRTNFTEENVSSSNM